MKTNFFRALFGSCAGLAIFDRLKEQSFARSVCHLFLMSIISAAIIGAGVFPVLKKSLHNSLEIFEENCQGIVCTRDRIEPELNPEKARSFVLHGILSVTYLPVNAEVLPENFQQECNQGLLWSADGRFLLWKNPHGDKFVANQMLDPLGATGGTPLPGKSALLEELKKTPGVVLKLEAGEREILTASKLKAMLDLVAIIGVAAMLMCKTLLEVILYIGMFAVVTLLMNMNRPDRLPFKQMIVLAIYAGFPPMLIGSTAEALRLPYLSFNMIYVLGMTFYLIVIMNRLERLRQEQQWRDEGR